LSIKILRVAKIQFLFELFDCYFLGVKNFCFNEVRAIPRSSTRLSGGGWAKPKNGEAHFWAWVGDAV